MSGEAKYLSKTVRVDVEKPELQAIFGTSGVAVRVSAKDQSVNFLTERNQSVIAKLSETVIVGPTAMTRNTPMMSWRLTQLEKVSILLDMGMDSAEVSWPLETFEKQPQGAI